MPVNLTNMVEKASREMKEITGLDHSTTLGIDRDNSNWKVTLELVEKHSIPDQMDILGIYEIFFDEDGNLVSFKRKGLRKRMDMTSIE